MIRMKYELSGWEEGQKMIKEKRKKIESQRREEHGDFKKRKSI